MDYRAEKEQRLLLAIRELEAELPRCVTDYLMYLSTSTSALTRLAYARDLTVFFRFLTAETRIFGGQDPRDIPAEALAQVTLGDLLRYQDYLSLYPRPPRDEEDDALRLTANHEAGIARKLSALRSFFRYLYVAGSIPENVTEKLRLPRIAEKPIVYLEPQELARMFAAVHTGEGLSDRQRAYTEGTRARDIAILTLLLGTGIRESELVGMDLDDVDPAENAFLVTRKGGDTAVLYYNDQVKAALVDYLAVRRQQEALPGHEAALFLSTQRKRLSPRALQDLVKKYAGVGVPLGKKKVSAHKMRSTFGTALYAQTGDIYLVATALGHKSVETTRKHYAHSAERMRRDAAMRVDFIPEEKKKE